MLVKCERCNQEYDKINKSKYCIPCRPDAHREKRKRSPKMVQCERCDNIFKKHGPAKYCADCRPEVQRERDRARSSRCRTNQLQREYSLSKEEYNNLIAAQRGKCAICGSTKRLCVDHDHITGLVRGLLCTKCNTAVAALGDDAKGLWRAFEYMVGVVTRPDWNAYYLMLAHEVAIRSDCRRSSVGAVIVADTNELLSTGYVGVAPGESGCLDGACPRGLMSLTVQPRGGDYSNCISTHAEENALRHANTDLLKGARIYVTRRPCDNCQNLLKESGIIRAIWPNGEMFMEDYTERVSPDASE